MYVATYGLYSGILRIPVAFDVVAKGVIVFGKVFIG